MSIVIDWAECNNALRALCLAAFQNSKDKGFWDGTLNVPEKLCLVHSEISEALEEFRDGHPVTAIRLVGPLDKPEGFPIELADVLIRLFDLAGYFGINLCEAIKMKAEFNARRPHRHGGKVC